jgi:hypothetical protein
MAATNLHLEHLEDAIIDQGIDGGRGSINFLRELRDMLKGNSSGRVNMTVKWDGAPAIFAGMLPMDKKFFVAKKSLFNKEPKFYTSVEQIKSAPELSGDLETKFIESFNYLSKLKWPKILQGDLMFTEGDKSEDNIDGERFITFTPNTITYAVKKDSGLGKEINKAKYGIVFHTTYTGNSIPDLKASFGADVSKLGNSSDVWVDDATYKDVSGNASMTAKETLALTQYLSKTGKAFQNIKRNDLNKFMRVQKEFTNKGALGAGYKTYINTLIRSRKFKPSANEYLNYVDKYYDEKVIAKVKTEKTKAIKREIKQQLISELRSVRKMIDALAYFQTNLVQAKQIIISTLNRVKSVGTFVRTPNGYKVVNPEGYVAIDKDGSAVKLVDRMEFSYNNFTVAKDWNK